MSHHQHAFTCRVPSERLSRACNLEATLPQQLEVCWSDAEQLRLKASHEELAKTVAALQQELQKADHQQLAAQVSTLQRQMQQSQAQALHTPNRRSPQQDLRAPGSVTARGSQTCRGGSRPAADRALEVLRSVQNSARQSPMLRTPEAVSSCLGPVCSSSKHFFVSESRTGMPAE